MKRYLVFLCGPIFFQGITTTASPIDLPKTGQTVSYALGDDGSIQAGVA